MEDSGKNSGTGSFLLEIFLIGICLPQLAGNQRPSPAVSALARPYLALRPGLDDAYDGMDFQKLQSKLARCVLVSGLALSLPQASAEPEFCGPGSGLALSGRLTASSSPKVGAFGKGVKSERNVFGSFAAAGRKVLNCKLGGMPRPLTLGEVASRKR